jgi:hypothetical protein
LEHHSIRYPKETALEAAIFIPSHINLPVNNEPCIKLSNGDEQHLPPESDTTTCYINAKEQVDVELLDLAEGQPISNKHEGNNVYVDKLMLNPNEALADTQRAKDYSIIQPGNAAASEEDSVVEGAGVVGGVSIAREAAPFAIWFSSGFHSHFIPSHGSSPEAQKNENSRKIAILDSFREKTDTDSLATPPPQYADNSNLSNTLGIKVKEDVTIESVKMFPTPPKDKNQMILQTNGVDGNQINDQAINLEAQNIKIVAQGIFPVVAPARKKSNGVELEKNQANWPTKTDLTPRVPSGQTLDGFNNLFRIYYDGDPQISPNVEIASNQIEILFNLSTLYGLPEKSIVELRKGLANRLRSGKNSLWRAIMEDPSRWLFLSLFLRSPSIFREAIIHIVGSHSHISWTHRYEELIPINVSIFINNNIEKLVRAKECADAALLDSTIKVDGVDVLHLRRGVEYDVYNYWHEWYREQIADAFKARKNGSNIDGVRYQLIASGGDLYLPQGETLKRHKCVLAAHGVGLSIYEEETFITHLRSMKEQAKTIVRPLCTNHSNLDPLKEGIKYLTCTNVMKGEFPWEMDKMDPYFGPL